MVIHGRVASSRGISRYNILLQTVSMELPDVQKLYAGTINIDIRPHRFRVLRAPIIFRRVNWGIRIEDIELVPVSRILHNGERLHIAAYLYLPVMGVHRRGGRILEIWSEKIPAVVSGDEVAVSVPDGCLMLV